MLGDREETLGRKANQQPPAARGEGQILKGQ